MKMMKRRTNIMTTTTTTTSKEDDVVDLEDHALSSFSSTTTTINDDKKPVFRGRFPMIRSSNRVVLVIMMVVALLLLSNGIFFRDKSRSSSSEKVEIDCTFQNSSSILDQILVHPPINDEGKTTKIIRQQQQQQQSQEQHFDNPHRLTTKKTPKVLCLLMTHSNADQQVRAVWETWANKCDKLLIASNTTTTGGLPSIVTRTPSTYWNLWPKLNETLHYILHNNNNEFQDYDWIYKIDDDSFVIMENLKHFLLEYEQEQEQLDQKQKQQPIVFGHILSDKTWSEFGTYFYDIPENRPFGDYFFKYVVSSATEHTAYLAGGSGYVMNRKYLEEFIKALDGKTTMDIDDTTTNKNNHHPPPPPTTLYGAVPEDMAHGAVMLARGIVPQNSRDLMGRERFLPEPPDLWELKHRMDTQKGEFVVMVPNKSKQKTTSSLSSIQSTARYAISFHHVSPTEMRQMYQRLYTCRTVV